MSYVALLARLLYDPQGAVSALRSERPIVHAIGASIFASIVYNLVLAGFVSDIVTMVRVGAHDVGAMRILFSYVYALPRYVVSTVFISAVYVPVALFGLGGFHRHLRAYDTMRREYRATATVALSSWAVVLLLWTIPAAIFADPFSVTSRLVWSLLPAITFLVPMAVNLAGIEDAGYVLGASAALTATCSLMLLPLALWSSMLLTSPVFVIILFFILRGVFRDWSTTRANRERLQRNLEAATVNPADASAHLNLGLIYQEKGDLDRAFEHFQRAVEIDPTEVDALYQIGRIERERGSLPQAIATFDRVVQIDSDHSAFEIWREIGMTYLAARQYEDARSAFERFLDRRPSDAEGLYHMGVALDALGRRDEAREQMRAVVEAVRTAPMYKYRLERRWLAEAETFLKQQ